MVASVQTTRDWVSGGTALFVSALASLDDVQLAEPSGLPGWSRAHVIAHVDGNARALSNLVTWARTGVETPMYTSNEQRNADIAAGAALPAATLRERFAESTSSLESGFDSLSDSAWSADVRTIQGRTIPASQIPWLRSREVMIHAVDLNCGVTFADMPDEFLAAVIDDIVTRRSSMDQHPEVTLRSPGHEWQIAGLGETVEVSGTLAQVAAYLTGRAPLGPELPAWL